MQARIRKVVLSADGDFRAELWVDGEREATVAFSSASMTATVTFREPINQRAFLSFVKRWAAAQPPATETFPDDTTLFIAHLFNNWREIEHLRKRCKSQTMFRVVGDPPGSWRVIASPYGKTNRAYLARKHGAAVEAVANELLD